MPVKNKITVIAFLSFFGILIFDTYQVLHYIRVHQDSTQFKFQYRAIFFNKVSESNCYGELPENRDFFTIYSKIKKSKRDIFNELIPGLTFCKTWYLTSKFTNKIILSHLIICNLDLPPPFCMI